MSAADLGSIDHVPGRLSFGGTSLATAWPHGGTGLGVVDQIRVLPNRKLGFVKDEGYGRTSSVIDLGEEWWLFAILRGFDADAVEKVFPATRAGAVSGKRGIFYPGTTFRPGTAITSVKLIFTPDDEFNHRFLVMRAAVPAAQEQTELLHEVSDEFKIPVVFYALVDGTEALAYELKEDITL